MPMSCRIDTCTTISIPHIRILKQCHGRWKFKVAQHKEDLMVTAMHCCFFIIQTFLFEALWVKPLWNLVTVLWVQEAGLNLVSLLVAKDAHSCELDTFDSLIV